MKINFTKENAVQLQELATRALFEGTEFVTKFGGTLSVYELIHTTTINQLGEIKDSLSKKIDKIEKADEWIQPDSEKLAELRRMKELVNLIIGYKRFQLELEENSRKKEALSKKIAELEESQKTPDEKLKELKAELAALETNNLQ